MMDALYEAGDPLLTEAELAWLTERGQTLHRGPEHVFFKEGETTDFVLLILKGHVKVSAGRPKRIVAIRKAGEVVGEMSPLRRKPRSATVETIDEVDALHIPAARWIEFLDRHPRAARAQLVAKDERLDQATQRIAEAELAVERRLALAFVDMIDSGLGGKVGDHIVLRTSQQDLASFAGASLDAVKKIIRLFKEREIIRTGRQTVTITRYETLRRIAGGELTAAGVDGGAER
ncbi:Crp/Fnr family transcriptional regulator [Spirillospora sp. CA-253888]